MFDVPPFTDFYLLEFTLSGWCQIWQDKTYTELPAGSVAIVNPFQAFKKAWMPGARQLLLLIDKPSLVEREFLIAARRHRRIDHVTAVPPSRARGNGGAKA